jgi:protocatechuate 3,4-dioxygenase beta subunit
MTYSHDDHDGFGPHQHDLGLAYDLGTVLDRRLALKLFAGAGLVTLAGCASAKSVLSASSTTAAGAATSGAPASTAASTATTAATAATTAASAAATTAGTTAQATTASSALATDLSAIPQETGGPYPADGTNGPNVLVQSGIVRRDITSSFGTSTSKAPGVPTTITLKIVKAGTGAPFAGAAVYLWHCDQAGRYSLYSQGATNENYLRGVQEADADGVVSFTTIYPGCYSGRWPHVHFEVFSSLAQATATNGKIATSQLALPADTSKAVYAADGYSASVSNLSRITLATDNVFRDGAERETPTATGSATDGITLALTVPVAG